MRLPSSARFAGLLAFACVSLSLALVAPGALAAEGGDLEQVEAQLARCKQDLALGRKAVQEADGFLDAVRKKRVIFFSGPFGGFVPVRVDDYRDELILEFVTGRISRDQLARSLASIARRLAQTLRVLAELRDEARADVEQTLKRCAALTEQRDRLRAGGGGDKPPGETSPYSAEGGTATRLSITVEGVTQTRNLVTYERTANDDVPGTRRGSVSGSVNIVGTLPAGWNVYVLAEGKIVKVGQGAFTVNDPIGSDRRSGATAMICAKGPPPPPAGQICTVGAKNGDVSIRWHWVP